MPLDLDTDDLRTASIGGWEEQFNLLIRKEGGTVLFNLLIKKEGIKEVWTT